MNRRTRKRIVEEINNAFIGFLRDYRGTRFIDYFKAINNEIINRQGNVTTQELRTIIERETDNVDFEDIAVFSLLLGALTSIIEGAHRKENRENLALIAGIVSVYSLSDPKRFVGNVYKSLKNPSSKNQRSVHKMLNRYKDANAIAIKNIKTKQRDNLIRTQLKSKTREARYINKKMAEWHAEGKPFESQRHLAQRDINANKIMMRALDTEIHANLEVGKAEQAIADGFEFKIWRTQGDDRVRKTTWHNFVADKRIPINDDFNLGNTRASTPGDVRLEPGERINCRCYLVFE